MITGLGGPTARCVRRGALFRPSHGDADNRAPGAVDGPGDRALNGRRLASRADGLADRTLSRGAQT
jgi:hypothetical protein